MSWFGKMKQPKYSFGQKLITPNCRVFTVTRMCMDKQGHFNYADEHIDYVWEHNLSPYVEPKPKVKMWLYRFKAPSGIWSITTNYYRNDSHFQTVFQSANDFQKLEWSEIEVKNE